MAMIGGDGLYETQPRLTQGSPPLYSLAETESREGRLP